MRTSTLPLLLFIILLFTACQKEEVELTPTPDTTAPVFTRLRVNYDFDVSNNDRFELSISEGFHLMIDVKDENIINFFDGFFLVNNDPEKRKNILSSFSMTTNEFGGGFLYEPSFIQLSAEERYDFQIGDTFHFYFTVRDEFDNETEMSFIADLVE